MSGKKKDNSAAGGPGGLLAEFAGPGELVEGARKVREAGYTCFDAFSPFPVHGIDEAMGIRQSPLQYMTLAGGVTGAAAGLIMQWWMVSVDYPFILSGKPFFALPAFIPVMFETTILFGAIGTFLGMLFFAGLPRLYHVVFTSQRFRKASSDGFFIHIEAADPKYNDKETAALLEEAGGTNIESLIEEGG